MRNRLNISIDIKLNEIAEHYIYKQGFQDQIGLYEGNMGVAIFLALYYKHTNDERYFEKLNLYIDQIIDTLNASKHYQPSLSSGVAGWGWLIEYLKKEELVDIDTDQFLNEIDQMLSNLLNDLIKSRDFDQLHGAISVSLYYLSRDINEPLIRVIKALDQTKIADNNETKWMRYDTFRKVHIYDFGLAHGIAGYLYFLSKCYQKNILPNLCMELIQGIIRFLRNNVQSLTDVGSFFPSTILTEAYGKEYFVETKSRIAWCYGDLGILYTLMNVGEIIQDYSVVNDSIAMLQKTSMRRDFSETTVVDAEFCHGSSGVAHIYYKIFKKTGIVCFKDAAEYWYNVTLNFSKEKNGICGYLFREGIEEWKPNSGLLTGIAGLGLSLLTYENFKLSTWDQCLLLS